MIEINLLDKKGSDGSLALLEQYGITQINWKMVLIAAILYNAIPWGVQKYLDQSIVEHNKRLEELKEKNKTIKAYLNKHKGVKKELVDFNNHIEKLKKRVARVEEITKIRSNPALLLENIARSIPKDVWLTELMITDNQEIVLKGGAETYKSLNKFMDTLNQTDYFKDTLNLGDTKTINERIGNLSTRYELFEIRGRILSFSTWSG